MADASCLPLSCGGSSSAPASGATSPVGSPRTSPRVRPRSALIQPPPALVLPLQMSREPMGAGGSASSAQVNWRSVFVAQVRRCQHPRHCHMQLQTSSSCAFRGLYLVDDHVLPRYLLEFRPLSLHARVTALHRLRLAGDGTYSINSCIAHPIGDGFCSICMVQTAVQNQLTIHTQIRAGHQLWKCAVTVSHPPSRHHSLPSASHWAACLLLVGRCPHVRWLATAMTAMKGRR